MGWEERAERWLEFASIVLSHVGCWLLVAGMLAGLALNRAILGWTLCSIGWFIGGLGGSFFAKAYFVTARRIEAKDKNPEAQHWLWPELRFGFFMILAVITAPLLAPLAIGFTFLLDVILIIWFFVLVLIKIKKSLSFGPRNSEELSYESTDPAKFD